jgi:hypothetical protein
MVICVSRVIQYSFFDLGNDSWSDEGLSIAYRFEFTISKFINHLYDNSQFSFLFRSVW